MDSTFVVGITGCSGSGKTVILNSILSHFGAHETAIISQDNYYFSRDQQPLDDNGVKNFDLPESINLEDFKNDILKIKAGEKLTRKEYTYNNPNKAPGIIETNPAPLVFVEGIFIFSHVHIRNELNYRIYVDAENQIRLQRRLHRDFIERGYDEDDVNYRYHNHVLPAYHKYIEPYKENADLVIVNNGNTLPDLGDLVAFLKTKSA